MPNIRDFVVPVFESRTFGPYVDEVAPIFRFYEANEGTFFNNLQYQLDFYAQYLDDGMITCEIVMSMMPESIVNSIEGALVGQLAPGTVATDPGYTFDYPDFCSSELNPGLPAEWVAVRGNTLQRVVHQYTRTALGPPVECVGAVSSDDYFRGAISYPGWNSFTVGAVKNGYARNYYPDTHITIGAQTYSALARFDYDVWAIMAAWFPSCVVPPSPTINIYNFEKGDTTCANFSQIFNPFGIKWSR